MKKYDQKMQRQSLNSQTDKRALLFKKSIDEQKSKNLYSILKDSGNGSASNRIATGPNPGIAHATKTASGAYRYKGPNAHDLNL